MDFEKMTKEEALALMDLEPDADIVAIDKRFWQMSKKYRGKDDPESVAKEDEIAAIYDIASGKRDARIAEEARIAKEPKILGMTFKQWGTFFGYTWVKIVLGVVLVSVTFFIVYSIINRHKNDNSVVVFGHLALDKTYICQTLKEMDGKTHYVDSADVVVPNDKGVQLSEHGDETFNALFFTKPEVLITEKITYPYYFDAFADMAPIEDQVMAGLSEKSKAGVAPVYMSLREAVERTNEVYWNSGFAEDMLDDPSQYSDEPILIGLEITDSSANAKLGIRSGWNDGNMTLVIGQCKNCKDSDRAAKMMIALIDSAFE